MARLVLSLLLLLVAFPAAAQKTRVTMAASASRVQVGEPFAIEIRADISGDEPDNLETPHFGNLQVLAHRVSRPMSFSFGFGSGGQQARMESHLVHGYTLRATAPGKYVIQPAILTVGGRKFASQSLTIEVVGAALAPTPGQAPDPQALQEPQADSISPPQGALSGARYDNDIFLRTVVDKNRAYVSEQVTVTVYLYVRGALTQNPSITREPTTEGFWVQDLLPIQRALAPVRQEVSGRMFQVYVLRRYAAFPLRAGKLEIGAPAVELGGGGSLFDLLTGPATPIKRSGVAVPVEALALPVAAGDVPVHVGSLELRASIDPSQAKVGDALTLQVVAKGSGNLKGLKLPSPVVTGAEVLAPEITDQLTTDLDQVGGQRTFRWLILPRTPGTLRVPALAVQTFDPESKQAKRVETRALEVAVTGSADPSAAAPAQPSAAAVSDAPSASAPGQLELGPARLSSQLRRAQPPVTEAAWFWWLLFSAPALVLGAAVVRLVRSRLARRRVASPAQAALQGAEQKLSEAADAARASDPARAYGSLIAALRAALQARLSEPVGGLTMSMLEEHCLARGMPRSLVERVVRELSACEQARFDPSRQAGESLDAHVQETRSLVAELSRFVPREAA